MAGEWLTMSEAAAKLGVSNHQIRRLIKEGILAAEQVVPDAPYQIRASDLQDERVTAALSQPYYLDVTHPQANKGGVVLALSKQLGIPVDEIATIGDSENDTSMFRQGGFAIAMGNADDETKAQADAVVADDVPQPREPTPFGSKC